MDFDKRERLASRRVIISEALMVIAVIAIVIALAFIVSGYWVNSDFTVERQGMLQINSIPTGASLIVDGETSWLSQTNASKILKSGEHTISLTKDGYDTWSRTIKIRDGLLYRIRYPRLFLQERTPTSVLDTAGVTFASFSPDRHFLLLANNTTKWKIVKLDSEELKPTTIDIAPYFSSINLAEGATEGDFTGKIISATWDSNNEHILFKTNSDTDSTWTLLDIKEPTNSLMLSNISNLTFDEVNIFDNSASTLLALDVNNNLYTIDVSRRKVSESLVSHVEHFSYYGNQIIYSALNVDTLNNNTTALDESSSKATNHNSLPANDNGNSVSTSSDDPSSAEVGRRYVLAMKSPSDEKTHILKYTDTPVRPAILQFYDEKYLATLASTDLTLFSINNIPADNLKAKSSYPISFSPNTIKTADNGEYIVMSEGNHIAVLDMEAEETTEWMAEGLPYHWLADGMIYSISDKNLIVYDFDGLNRRSLSANVSSDFPVTITDDKWLYYFDDTHLLREVVTR